MAKLKIENLKVKSFVTMDQGQVLGGGTFTPCSAATCGPATCAAACGPTDGVHICKQV